MNFNIKFLIGRGSVVKLVKAIRKDLLKLPAKEEAAKGATVRRAQQRAQTSYGIFDFAGDWYLGSQKREL